MYEDEFEEGLLKEAAYSLTKEQENELIAKARKNDPFARMRLERALREYFMQSLNQKRRSNSLLSKENYVNEIMLQLPKYIQGYDAKRGISFKVYVEQHAAGLVQNLNDTLVPGSFMNRNERPLQARYNMAKQYVEGVTPGGKASDADILKRIKEAHGETWDQRKLDVAKKLNVTNLRTNYEVENGEGDAVSHRDQFSGGGVRSEEYYEQREEELALREKAHSPSLNETERKIVLEFLKEKSKLKTSIATNQTLYEVNKALKKFEALPD